MLPWACTTRTSQRWLCQSIDDFRPEPWMAALLVDQEHNFKEVGWSPKDIFQEVYEAGTRPNSRPRASGTSIDSLTIWSPTQWNPTEVSSGPARTTTVMFGPRYYSFYQFFSQFFQNCFFFISLYGIVQRPVNSMYIQTLEGKFFVRSVVQNCSLRVDKRV